MDPYQEIIKLLDENQIDYQKTEHEAVYTCAQAAKVRGVSEDSGAKALLLKADGEFILALLQGNRRLDSKKLKKTLQIKSFRFAYPNEVEDTMHCQIGACYPFGNIVDLPTYADISLSNMESINFNAGHHEKSIQMKWNDFEKIAKPKIINIAQE
ncbi:MAG: hypothetical protein NTZ65_00945 [Candidatus Berkelbacteria bacterium]|nr:hypothetical protein [Candidatus Berkelbacteria bacterium]